jgi:hypothetical protein
LGYAARVSSGSSIAVLISSLSVIFGVALGVATLLQWRRTRYLTAAVELVHTIQTPDFTRSIARVVQLPKGADPKVILADAEMMAAVYAVSHVFESLGVLVFHRLLPLHLVDHLIGGYVRASWARIGPYVLQQRQELGAMFGEWFQWLAERMAESPAPGKEVGAAVAHKEWKP